MRPLDGLSESVSVVSRLGKIGSESVLSDEDILGTFLIEMGSYSYSRPSAAVEDVRNSELLGFSVVSLNAAADDGDGWLVASGDGAFDGFCVVALDADLTSLISFGSKIHEKEVHDELLREGGLQSRRPKSVPYGSRSMARLTACLKESKSL